MAECEESGEVGIVFGARTKSSPDSHEEESTS